MMPNQATTDFPALDAATLTDLLAMPWTIAEAIHEMHLAWCHDWAHFCLGSPYLHHTHEYGAQLEIPDPIAATGDHDLFA